MAAWTTLLPASQRSPAVRFDYWLWAFSASHGNNHRGPYGPGWSAGGGARL